MRSSIEPLAKLSAIVPLWMISAMVDKHLMGLPLLEGSIWRSLRIPPRTIIKPSYKEKKHNRLQPITPILVAVAKKKFPLSEVC